MFEFLQVHVSSSLVTPQANLKRNFKVLILYLRDTYIQTNIQTYIHMYIHQSRTHKVSIYSTDNLNEHIHANTSELLNIHGPPCYALLFFFQLFILTCSIRKKIKTIREVQ